MAYNECAKKEMVTLIPANAVAKGKKPVFGLMVQPFMGHTEVAFAVASFNAVNFGGGITLQFFARKKPNRQSYYNELKFKSVKEEGQNGLGPTRVDFSVQSVKMVNTIRFSYPKKTNSVFWNVGLINGFRLSSEARNQGNGFDLIGPDHTTGFETGAIVGGGMTFKIASKIECSLEFRYEVEQEALSASTYVGAHNLGIILGIQF